MCEMSKIEFIVRHKKKIISLVFVMKQNFKVSVNKILSHL